MSELVVSAVVVAYASVDELDECLASLRPALAAVEGATEVVVIDNAAPGSPVRAVRDRHPDVRWLEQHANAGFAGGVQAGIDASAGEWVLALNDDATIAPDGVVALLDAARSAPDVGAVAAEMRFAATGTINSAGIDVDVLGVASDRLLGAEPGAGGAQPVEVFGASAGAALYRRAMLDEVGGFDTTFFAYLEDVDLAWRARMAGWRALVQPRAVVLHHHSTSLGHGSPVKHRLVGRNRMRLLAKDATTRHLAEVLPAIVLHELAHVGYLAVRERTLAALWGRLEGLREWRAYRRAGASGRRPQALAPTAGLAGALRRSRAWPRARRP